LVIEDHAVVRAGLRQFLADSAEMEVSGEAASAAEALERLREGAWDVALLDLSLPDGSGIELLARIREVAPALPVLVLSMHAERRYAVQLLRSGASGYLQKEALVDELKGAIRGVLQGRRYVSPAVAELLSIDTEQPDAMLHGALSEREFEIFCLLAQGLGASRIAQELNLSVKTVSTYRSRILEKMHMTSNADMTYYAIKNGLMGRMPS
jgi:two-component system invasion response regulator UvrY